MPPRNSNTKAFRPYHHVKSPYKEEIPISTIYSKILKPEAAIGNEIQKDFESYKKSMMDNGIDISKKIQSLFKDDDDGDIRYVNTSWYRSKLKE